MTFLFFRFFEADDHGYRDTFAIKLKTSIQVCSRVIFDFFNNLMMNLRRNIPLALVFRFLTMLDFHLFHLLLEVLNILAILIQNALIKEHVAHAACFVTYGLCYLFMHFFSIFNANDFQRVDV